MRLVIPAVIGIVVIVTGLNLRGYADGLFIAAASASLVISALICL